MKNVLSLITLLVATFSQAQSIKYKVIEDNPDANPSSFINAEWFGMDGGSESFTGLFVGLQGNYQLTDKLGLEGAFRLKYLNLDKPPSGPLFNIDAGANFLFTSFSKTKDIKVITKYTQEKDYKPSGTETTTTQQYFKAPGKVQRNLFLRAGITNRRNTYNATFGDFNFFSVGTYAGINLQTSARLRTEVQEGSNKYPASAGLLANFYADVVFYPVVKTPENITPPAFGRFGFKTGVQWYTPIERNFFSKMMFFLELGYRPLEKITLTFGVGLNLWKK